MTGWKKFVSWGMCQVMSRRPAVEAALSGPEDLRQGSGGRVGENMVVVPGRDDHGAAGAQDPAHLRQGGHDVAVGQQVGQGIIGAQDGVGGR
jgi:hypothetical protein